MFINISTLSHILIVRAAETEREKKNTQHSNLPYVRWYSIPVRKIHSIDLTEGRNMGTFSYRFPPQ